MQIGDVLYNEGVSPNKYNSSIHDGISETNHSKIKCDGNQYLKNNENI